MSAQMHTAAKPEGPAKEADASPLFGKLLGSIEGLQQRLGDFSFEDITKAEETAKTLIRRLVLLRNRLDLIAEIKQAFLDMEADIDRDTAADRALVGGISQDAYPRVQALVDAGKVIRLHRFLRAVSSDPETELVNPSRTSISSNSDATAVFDLDSRQDAAETASESPTPPTESFTPYSCPENTPAPNAIELPPPDESEIFSHERGEADSQAPIDTLLDLPPNEMEPSFAVEMPSPAAEFEEPFDTSPEIKLEAPANDPFPLEGEVIEDDAALLSRAAADVEERIVSPISASAFDARLLDDLIQNYGELIPYTGTPSRSEPVPPVEAVLHDLPALPPVPLVETTDPEPEEVCSEANLPPEPNFVLAEPMPAPEPPHPAPAQTRVPSVRAADIDRQLKKIIADYGEYDLYSRSGSSNFKKSGIVAFIILGLVLFGVYFFKSSAQSVPSPAGSTVQAAPSPESSPDGATAKTGQNQ